MDFTQQNQDALLQELNQFTRRTHTLDEVYLLDVLLCDNEVDRDFERFSDSALETLKTLFVGKTGIFDHDPSGKNQTARIFSTRLETHPEQLTSKISVHTAKIKKTSEIELPHTSRNTVSATMQIRLVSRKGTLFFQYCLRFISCTPVCALS